MYMNPEGLNTVSFGRLLFTVGSSPYLCRRCLIYEFAVGGIEYGKGEGRNQGAAGDAAATQALAGLNDQYGTN
jgi:hypothetical protein